MMNTLLRPALFACAVAFSLSSAVPGAEVRGRILGDDGKPLARAVVRIVPEPAAGSKPGKISRVETGDDGGFVAAGIAGAAFRVRIEAAGYAPLTQPEIPAGASLQLRVKRGAKLSGIVRDRASKAPVVGATVLAWEKAAEPFGTDAYRTAKTGKDGRFMIADLPEGKVAVEAKAARKAPAKSANVALPKSDFELLMDDAAGLSGLVTDTAGDPVSGAEVTASWQGPAGVKRKAVKTGADGRYRIAEAAADAVTDVAVRAPKFLRADRDGPAPADGVVEFVLERGGSIAGIVHDTDGKVPPSFQVKVHGVSEGAASASAEHDFTDPAGAFRIDDLDPGTYTIEVVAEHYAKATKDDLVVAAEQVEDAGTVKLFSKSVLHGRVVAARDRAPIAGATLHVSVADTGDRADVTAPSTWTVTSAADGTFQTTTIPAGTYELALEHPQFAPARTRVTFQPDTDAAEVVVEMYRGGSLTGSVVDSKRDAVSGVRIVATQGTEGDSRVADTGSDGHYYIDGLTPGAWTVTRQLDRPAGSSAVDTKYAQIREGETATVDFDEQAKVTVSGVIIKGEAPIPNAAIYFVAIDNNALPDGKSARADAEGRYQIGLVHGGRYQVSVVFGGTAVANGHNVLSLVIPDQPEVHQDIVFAAETITGHVLDPDGNGVRGALVTALRQGTAAGETPRQTTAMTFEDGAFKLDAMDPGTYRVTARAKAYASADEFPVVVGDDQPDPDLVLTLQRGWIMKGRLVDRDGRGLPGALVVVAPDGAAESGYLPSQTDATGAFRITAPADGRVNVGAIAARFAPAVQTDVEQPADGSASDVVLTATPGGTLHVRVSHRSGDPVAGAQVAYQPVPLFPGCDVVMDRNRFKPTDPDGTTRMALFYPGEYVVSIPGRHDTAPVQVVVSEGAETEALIEVP